MPGVAGRPRGAGRHAATQPRAAALLHRTRLARRARGRDPRLPLRALHRAGRCVRACARAGPPESSTVHRSHTMKTELIYLLLTAILTGLLWIPVVIGYVTRARAADARGLQAAPNSPLPDWVNRANRAHLNAVENFAPFAAVVLIAHVSGISSGTTVRLRRGLLLCPARPRAGAHQRLRPVQGAHGALHRRLDRVPSLRDRRPAPRVLSATGRGRRARGDAWTSFGSSAPTDAPSPASFPSCGAPRSPANARRAAAPCPLPSCRSTAPRRRAAGRSQAPTGRGGAAARQSPWR